MRMSVANIAGFQAKLAKAVASVITAEQRARREVTEDLLTKSIARAPLDEGTLRASGYVNHSRDFSEVGFGGESASYAVIVHEDLEASHAEGTSAKFLEGPLEENREKYAAHIINAVRGGLRL